MAVELNHTVISAYDNQESAKFFTEILGLAEAFEFGPFMVVQTNNNVSLDFVTSKQEIISRHFAFLVSEIEFDAILGRVQNKKLTYWAEHTREKPFAINTYDGGRGFYFNDPNGHFLEIITRPYKEMR